MQIDSDFPLDKVIISGQTSISMGAGDYSIVRNLAHGLPFTPLMFGNYSTSPDFTTTYSYDSGPPSTNIAANAFAYQPTIRSDSANITISAVKSANTAVTLYFRYFGFMPSNVSVSIPHTNINTGEFMINSDQKQVRLLHQGMKSFPNVGFDSTWEENIITHNLGYRPQSMLWVERSEGTQLIEQISLEGSVDIRTTTTQALLRVVGNTLGGVAHYRIYANE